MLPCIVLLCIALCGVPSLSFALLRFALHRLAAHCVALGSPALLCLAQLCLVLLRTSLLHLSLHCWRCIVWFYIAVFRIVLWTRSIMFCLEPLWFGLRCFGFALIIFHCTTYTMFSRVILHHILLPAAQGFPLRPATQCQTCCAPSPSRQHRSASVDLLDDSVESCSN